MKRSLLIVAVVLLSAVAALAETLPPLEGLVEPHETVEFSSEVAGILAEVAVERGSRVCCGQEYKKQLISIHEKDELETEI